MLIYQERLFTDLSNKVYIPNNTDLSVFNMITSINQSKTLTKHISCEYKCRFDGKTCYSNQWSNNDKYQCVCKKIHACEKDFAWNPVTCNCDSGKYLARIMDEWQSLFNYSGKTHNISTYPFLFIIRRFQCYYTIIVKKLL